MPTTAKGIVYPSASDNVNIAADIQNLATTADSIYASQTYGLTTKGDLLYRDASGAARLPVGATNSLVLRARPSQNPKLAYETPPTSDYYLISQVVSSGGNVNFTSIPQTFKDLQIDVTGRLIGVTGGQFDFRINGVTTNSNTAVRSPMSSASPKDMNPTTNGNFSLGASGSTSGSHNSLARWRIFDYAVTNRWKWLRTHGFESSSTDNFTLEWGYLSYESNSAVTQVEVYVSGSGSFYNGTTVSLWGIR